ncbi:MAG: hypothetical protein AAB373_00525 [Patescibacteria group bacterium]
MYHSFLTTIAILFTAFGGQVAGGKELKNNFGLYVGSYFSNITYLTKMQSAFELAPTSCGSIANLVNAVEAPKSYYNGVYINSRTFKRRVNKLLHDDQKTERFLIKIKEVMNTKKIEVDQLCIKNNIIYLTFLDLNSDSVVIATWDQAKEKFILSEPLSTPKMNPLNYFFEPAAINGKHLYYTVAGEMSVKYWTFELLKSATNESEYVEICTGHAKEPYNPSDDIYGGMRYLCDPEYNP